MTGSTFHVDLPYKWHTIDATVAECAKADALAYGIYVDLTDRGVDTDGQRVFRFWSPEFMKLQGFRNDLCIALGISVALNWQTVIKSEYTSDIPWQGSSVEVDLAWVAP